MSSESSLLKSTLSGIISLQDKLCDTLSGKYYNKESINELITPINGLTSSILSGYNERLSNLEEALSSNFSPNPPDQPESDNPSSNNPSNPSNPSTSVNCGLSQEDADKYYNRLLNIDQMLSNGPTSTEYQNYVTQRDKEEYIEDLTNLNTMLQ